MADKAGILLVHGAWHGPWCWDNFRTRLAAGGREVRAVQLSGHDGRTGRLWYRVGRYVDDVARAAADFPTPPVVVGHSLGGLVVQRYLESHAAPGAVLLASVPPGGTMGFSLRMMRRSPALAAKAFALLSLRPLIATPELSRRWFFTPSTPQPVVDACHARLQDESVPAYLDSLLFTRPRPGRVRVPLAVMGAELDAVFTVREVERTARAYNTRAEIFPAMGHDLMLDTGWEQVADHIEAWVAQNVDARSA